MVKSKQLLYLSHSSCSGELNSGGLSICKRTYFSHKVSEGENDFIAIKYKICVQDIEIPLITYQ